MCTWKKVDFLVALNNIHVVNESVCFYNYMETEILTIFCSSQALQNVFGSFTGLLPNIGNQVIFLETVFLFILTNGA